MVVASRWTAGAAERLAEGESHRPGASQLLGRLDRDVELCSCRPKGPRLPIEKATRRAVVDHMGRVVFRVLPGSFVIGSVPPLSRPDLQEGCAPEGFDRPVLQRLPWPALRFSDIKWRSHVLFKQDMMNMNPNI